MVLPCHKAIVPIAEHAVYTSALSFDMDAFSNQLEMEALLFISTTKPRYTCLAHGEYLGATR